jgi:hypothetical protein
VQELERRGPAAVAQGRPALQLRMGGGARIAWAVGSMAAAVLLIGGWLVGRWTPSPPTWAQVAESFNAEKFASVTIYTKSDAVSQPEETELWLASGGLARMQEGGTMIFAKGGQVSKAFDLQTRQPAAASAAAIACLSRATSKPEFALAVTLSAITGGRVMEATRLIEPVESSSADEAVFDIQSQTSPDVIRVWTGLRSRLPTRMQLSDPRTGGRIEAIFSYAKDAHDRFFDPAVFLERLH